MPLFQTEFSFKPFHITENESDWHGKEPVGELSFIWMVLSLVLTQRRKVSRKWPIFPSHKVFTNKSVIKWFISKSSSSLTKTRSALSLRVLFYDWKKRCLLIKTLKESKELHICIIHTEILRLENSFMTFQKELSYSIHWLLGHSHDIRDFKHFSISVTRCELN